ncbi:MAG: hypothetical protein HY220_04120 [Candidatus Sungbacteria bacterium]|uniref:Uncharacterized protein n=1 Tax=Candidatus Sungiibacteriota bacterium TaxID=2750080 RepID=A0A9D6QVV5_9BACT|nr:hypothetical protein [Candidatus Sungbacteria bacterium]
MPRVSQNKISKEFEQEIISSLFRALGKLREVDASLFLSEFFTRSEKVMLAKRFMVAFFIEQGFDVIAICRILKISKSTVYSVERELVRSAGGYAKIILIHKNQKNSKVSWEH